MRVVIDEEVLDAAGAHESESLVEGKRRRALARSDAQHGEPPPIGFRQVFDQGPRIPFALMLRNGRDVLDFQDAVSFIRPDSFTSSPSNSFIRIPKHT